MNLPDFPYTPHYADIHGQRMHYLDEGPRGAEVVVMLHGNPSWSYYYRRLVAGLKDRYRCIVPDHIGMGRSSRPRSGEYPFTFSRRADDLGELLDHLGITGNITLVLHDWGGMIGMTWATRHPERIKRLIILNTAAFHLPPDKSLPLSLRLSRVPLLNTLLNQGLNAFCLGAVRYGVVRPMLADAAAGYLAPYGSWSRRLAVRRFVEDIPIQPHDPGYDTVTAVSDRLTGFRSLPMLVCWGMQDFVFDEHFLDEWVRRFPDAQVHRFDAAGHYVLEDAGEEITSLIKNFLRSHPV